MDFVIVYMNEDYWKDMRDMIKVFLSVNWVIDVEMLGFEVEEIKLRGYGE